MTSPTSLPVTKQALAIPGARVVPVIPKQLLKSKDKKIPAEPGKPMRKAVDSVLGDTTPSSGSRADSPASTIDNTRSELSVLSSTVELESSSFEDTNQAAQPTPVEDAGPEQTSVVDQAQIPTARVAQDLHGHPEGGGTASELQASSTNEKRETGPPHLASVSTFEPSTSSHFDNCINSHPGILFGGTTDSAPPSPADALSLVSRTSAQPDVTPASDPSPVTDMPRRQQMPMNGQPGFFAAPRGPAMGPPGVPGPHAYGITPPVVTHWHNSGTIGPPVPLPFSMTGQFDYHTPSSADFNNVADLRQHLCGNLDVWDYADCVIMIPAAQGPNRSILAHRMILTRSTRLYRLLVQASEVPQITVHNEREYPYIQMPQMAYYQDIEMLIQAIRVLYGGNLLNHLDFRGTQSSKTAMSSVLSYIAAGVFLEKFDIYVAGLTSLHNILTPENIEQALDFSLPHSPTAVMYQDVVGEVLRITQEWLIRAIAPPRFTFDASVDAFFQRFPPALTTQAVTHRSRPSAANPALSGMTLGDFPSVSSADHALSAALLTLPSFSLRDMIATRILLDHRSATDARNFVRAIVTEREARRRRAVDAWRRLPATDQRNVTCPALWMEESVEEVPLDQGAVRVGLRAIQPRL